MTTIVWFRQDLRLADNPALFHAAARGPVVPVCLTSAPLGHLSLFLNGGFGSSRFDVKPLVVDGSSGGF